MKVFFENDHKVYIDRLRLNGGVYVSVAVGIS